VPDDDIIFCRADRRAWNGRGSAPDVLGVFGRECEAQGEHGDLTTYWINVVVFYDFHFSL
jgi:hypothetical protein